MMYTTQNQAIHAITTLLKAHGYDPRDYDLLTISDEYRLETGGFDNVSQNEHIVWAFVAGNIIT